MDPPGVIERLKGGNLRKDGQGAMLAYANFDPEFTGQVRSRECSEDDFAPGRKAAVQSSALAEESEISDFLAVEGRKRGISEARGKFRIFWPVEGRKREILAMERRQGFWIFWPVEGRKKETLWPGEGKEGKFWIFWPE